MKKIILIDMDNVLANFTKSFIKEIDDNNWERGGNIGMYITIKNDENLEKNKKIFNKKNFFLDFEPISGAIANVKEIIKDDRFEVFFCSSPATFYKYCVSEKYQWIEKYFGFEMTKRVILTKDKTLIGGDYLIDDKPDIVGLLKPTWEHIYFTQNYNKHKEGKRINKWSEWKEVLR